MKKIFTFAAALMTGLSLMAAEPSFESSEWGADDFSTVIANHDGITLFTDATAWGGNFSGTQYIALGSSCDITSPQKYFGVSATNAIDSVEIYWAPNGTDASNLVWVAWEDAANQLAQDVDYMGEGPSYTGSKSLEGATWQKFSFAGNDVHAVIFARQLKKVKLDGTVQSNFGLNKTVNILGVRVWVSGAAPSTDPVSQVTIAGPSECFVGQKATYTATTDVKATSYQWYIGSDAVEGATSAKFEFTPDAIGSYSISCNASNENNSEAASSNVITLTVTERQALEQVVVTDHTTWDFSKAATVSQIKWEGDQKDAAPVVMANIDGMNNDANFNSQALLFSGEYPIRDGKYCQGPHLEFAINAPGLLTVEYSNTGNRTAEEGESEGQEALRRFLTINGQLVPGDAGSMKSNVNTTTANIAVEPGNVVISGAMPYGADPTAAQYIRIYKVIYQRTGWPTAIDNNEVELKAVKRIVNGQLLIEKNGVMYNAQGVVVK